MKTVILRNFTTIFTFLVIKTMPKPGCILMCFANRTILILLTYLLFTPSAFTQNYSYKHYTILDGLVQNQVTSLYQDSRGFIWVGTKAGASRFDGKYFRNYTISDGLAPGLINSFLEDSKKKIYCITDKGYSVLTKGSFKVIDLFDSSIGSSFGPVKTNDEDFFVVNCDRTLFRCNGNKAELFYTLRDSDTNYLRVFFQTKDGKKYLKTKKGLFELKESGEILKINDMYNISAGEYKNGYIIVSEDNQKRDRSLEGVFTFRNNMVKKIWSSDHIDLNKISYVFDGSKIILYTKSNEWFIIDTNGTILMKEVKNNKFVEITSFLVDNEGNIWIGTENGLFRLQSSAFRNYDEESGLEKYIWTILEAADSSIFCASFKGNVQIIKNNQITNARGFEKFIKPGHHFYMGGIRTSDNRLLFPTDDGSIMEFYNGRFRTFARLSEKGKSPSCLYIYEDQQRNVLYFGTSEGLYTCNTYNGQIKRYDTKGLTVISIEKDKYDRFWIGASSRILLFDGEKFMDSEKHDSVYTKGAICSARDFRGNMWIGNLEGLFFYNYHRLIKLFGTPFLFIKTYHEKHLIAGTVKGIYYLDLEKFYNARVPYYHYFDWLNGFTGIECGQNGACVDCRGNIWIATSDRVVKFMPYRIAENKKPPRIHIRSLHVADKGLKWKRVFGSYDLSDTIITLLYKQNNIQIEYTGLSFSCPERVMYKTRLLGYDNDWSSPTTDNIITYTNLPFGKYVFEVLSCNEFGKWNQIPARVSFEIFPAFWQTLWFIIIANLLLMLSGALILYAIHHRVQLKRQEHRAVQKEIAAMQIKTINAQIDPHFIFNVITAIGTEVQEKNTDKAYTYFVKVSNLLRNSLALHDKIGRTLGEEIEFIRNYLVLQKYRLGERFDYVIQTGNNIDLNFEIPKMCIQIFVENAMKHGLEPLKGGGLLSVNISRENNVLRAEITDNGIGRERSAAKQNFSTGMGLQIIRKFFDVLNGYNENKAGFLIEDLFDKSGKPAGTKIILTIPFDYKIKI